ncbi:MAG TPA: DUF2769 domain-containing protein [Methanobacterium sp.]|nr:DUF2769 domain-containing protein [Methanobacterium sp.]
MVEDVNIPFKKENIIKCLCPTCPVQRDSICSREKMLNLQEILQGEKEPQAGDFPGMYCANGIAECEDIDTSKDCVCPDCAVYQEHGLDTAKPDFLYCEKGRAQK